MLKYLAGPLIGALIGYCTNYIAVKMLFYPRKEIRLFGHKLPFTPGAIPKGKDRLAKAIGNIVGTTLLTREDIEEKINPDKIGAELSNTLMKTMDNPIKDELLDLTKMQEASYEEKKELLSVKISEAAVDVLSKLNLSELLSEKGSAIIKEKVAGTMLQMFLTDELIASVIGPVGTEIENVISTQGVDYIAPVVKDKLSELEEESIVQLLSHMDIDNDVISSVLTGICSRLITQGLDKLLETLDIQSIVENKINDMSVEDLEKLVLTVMKKELNTIVNLGALIGFVLGVLNIIF